MAWDHMTQLAVVEGVHLLLPLIGTCFTGLNFLVKYGTEWHLDGMGTIMTDGSLDGEIYKSMTSNIHLHTCCYEVEKMPDLK